MAFEPVFPPHVYVTLGRPDEFSCYAMKASAVNLKCSMGLYAVDYVVMGFDLCLHGLYKVTAN